MRTLVIGATATFALICASTPVGASNITTLKSKAAALAARVDAMNVKLGILAEEYDQANFHRTQLDAQILATRAEIAQAQTAVAKDHNAIARGAVNSYVQGGGQTGLVPGNNPNALPQRETYLQVANGNLNAAIATLEIDQHRLAIKEQTLNTAVAQVTVATSAIDSSRSAASGVEAQLTGSLSNVNGQLATLVAAQEAAQRAQAARAAAAQAQAHQAQQAAPPQAAAVTTAAVTIAPSGSGSAAVDAAKSQIGVPYVWGGATPGAGFDCSGLAMWAWGRAGVNLPHSAQAQYDAIPHVSLSALEPGDLIFYASGGYIYHVIMYIGNGEAVQAINFGQPVAITPVWSGAYGAGRP